VLSSVDSVSARGLRLLRMWRRIPTQSYIALLVVLVGFLFVDRSRNSAGFVQAVLIWCAASCLIVGIAYAANWPWIFGKRMDGTISWLRALPVLPYQWFFWLYWCCERRIGGLRPYDEVAPGLFVGRRVLIEELPPRVDLVVDLTCEFAEVEAVRRHCAYRCLPTLDASVPPSEEELGLLMRDIAAHPGPVLLHCASGRGRAVAVAAGVLVLRGICADVTAALCRIRSVRPGIRPTPTHRLVIARVTTKILREKRDNCIARSRESIGSSDQPDYGGSTVIA